MKHLLLISSLACLAFPWSARAQTLINENWESYSSGATPVSPWQVRFGGGTTPAASTVTVTSQTVSGTTSNWALVGNNATNEPTSNPSLLATFTPQSNLQISFSFMIPANYGNSSQEFFNLGYINSDGSTVKTSLSLYLGPNYQAGTSMLGYRTSSSARVNLGGTFVAGAQVNVSLTNISKAHGTYDISWSSSSGNSGSQSGIALTTPIAENWNYVSFGESSAVTSTSLLYVDNVVVAVPEPKVSALMLGGFAALAAMRIRYRSC